MDDIKLVLPDLKYKSAYKKMMKNWRKNSAEVIPWFLKENYSDFPAIVKKFSDYSNNVNVPDEYVPSTTFWALKDKNLIGAVNIRHYLNDKFSAYFGHIGYAVKPEERQKGYGTKILKLALNECKKLNLKKVLICCQKDNTASAKVILNNNGVLENEILNITADKIIQRYWIEIR